MNAVVSNLVAVAVFLAVVAAAFLVARSVFGTVGVKSTAVEAGARITSLPAATPGVLRRRFARAVTSQHLVMPSGERHAQPHLLVRLSPEDADRLAPDGLLESLERDAERLYLAHAERNRWKVPSHVEVSVEIDPVLRPGWIPPARALVRHGEDAERAAAWARVGQPRRVTYATEDTGPIEAWPAAGPATATGPATTALAPATTVIGGSLELVGPEGAARLTAATVSVLGRGAQSPLRLSAPEVSTRHAAVRRRGTTWEIRDLGSTNGTAVDGERVGEDWRPVGPGSTIALAGVELTCAAGQ